MEYPVLHVCIADMTPTDYVIYDPAVDTGELLCGVYYVWLTVNKLFYLRICCA